MAGEFVIGVHGELEWDGRRLAGLWPKGQLEVCQDAGVTLFGPAVNIRTGKSLRLEHGLLAHGDQAVHGRSPASPCTPTSARASAACRSTATRPRTPSSRAAKAHVEILRCDGL